MTMKRTQMRVLAMLLAGLSALTVAQQAWGQQSARDLFSEAERRFEAGDFEFALNRYQLLIGEYPVSQYVPDAQFRIAVAYYRLGESEDALAQLDRVEQRYRSTRYIEYVPFWKGIAFYSLGRHAEAVEALTSFLDSGVQDSEAEDDALLHIALAQIALSNEDAARAALQRLLADEPHLHNAPYPLTLLLSLYAKSGLYDEILVLVDRIDMESLGAAWQPQVVLYQAEAYRGIGEIAEAAGLYRSVENARPDVATLAFQRLFQMAEAGQIQDQPSDVLRRAERALAGETDVLKELWLRVGIDSYNKGKLDLAELYFRRIWDLRAVETVPVTVPLYLSRLLADRGEYDAAVEILEEFLLLGVEDTESRSKIEIALGNLQMRQGDADAAISSLQSALAGIASDELYAQAIYQYAFALREAGRAVEALQVIDQAFSAGRIPASSADIQRLRSRILNDLGRLSDATQVLYEYLALQPGDGDAVTEYLKLLFELERYTRVVAEGVPLVDSLEEAGRTSQLLIAEARYVIGLSRVSLKQYQLAAEDLESVLTMLDDDTSDAALLVPYARYYAGWSYYREGEYNAARARFDALVSADSEHELAPRALYLSGWSSYRLGDYRSAATSLGRIGSYETDPELQIEATFLMGRTLVAQSAYQQAASTFRGIYADYPASSYADDARFEYGQALAALGNVDGAATAFAQLVANYPNSPLAESAAFRRAELYFNANRYQEAQAAFFTYRTEYPNGTRADQALYWGGIASDELGETAGALLLWERLIDEHRDSPFRPDAMQRAAAAHADRQEYRDALNLYTELQSAYPEAATAIGAERRIDQLVLLLNGLTRREAELYVTIDRADGAESEDGRQAIIELGRLAIYEDTATGIDIASVVPLLEDVGDKISVDPVSASQALFLLGEYAYHENEYQKAADLYLRAAEVGAVDRDLTALSLYRAATMYSTLGRTAEVRALVDQLEEHFPRSEWLEEARSLVREAN